MQYSQLPKPALEPQKKADIWVSVGFLKNPILNPDP
jgi:hypothetical protein